LKSTAIFDVTGFSEGNKRCLNSLHLTNPPDDLAAIKRSKGKRVTDTCEWLLAQEQYSAWYSTEGQKLLCLVGDPGIGKTMLSCFLVDELLEKARKTPESRVLYYFCDNKNEKRRTSTAIIRGLILQLLRQQPMLFKHIQPEYDQIREPLFESIDALWRIFLAMLRDPSAGEIYAVIDALDECETESRQELLECLPDLISDARTPALKLIITSRPGAGLEEMSVDLQSILAYLRVDSGKINVDLSRFINARVEELSKKKGLSLELTELARRKLTSHAGGTFLWVSLVINDLSKTTTSKFREKLNRLPKDLTEVYSKMLRSVDEEVRADVKFILLCVVTALRPLTIDELAMLRALGGPGTQHWDVSRLPPKHVLEELNDSVKICPPLLNFDSTNHTVNLIHQTVKDFLLDTKLHQDSQTTRYQVVTENAHFSLFQICWKYIGMSDLDFASDYMALEEEKRYSSKFWTDEIDLVLVSYVGKEWFKHVLHVKPDLLVSSEWSQVLVNKRLLLLNAWLRQESYHGRATVVQLLLDKGANINAQGGDYGTALQAAALRGHQAVVQLLLDKGADINAQGGHYGTALQAALYREDQAVVQLLLDKGADINAQSE
jgi:hypothetical protein